VLCNKGGYLLNTGAKLFPSIYLRTLNVLFIKTGEGGAMLLLEVSEIDFLSVAIGIDGPNRPVVIVLD